MALDHINNTISSRECLKKWEGKWEQRQSWEIIQVSESNSTFKIINGHSRGCLIIDGKDYGVQPFLTQTRDVDTWKLRPGVKAGDLGPKIGYNSKDNGWCSFDQVRIPRTNMLMGLC